MTYGFSPVWILMCIVSLSRRHKGVRLVSTKNLRKLTLYLKDIFLLYIPLRANPLPHTVHSNALLAAIEIGSDQFWNIHNRMQSSYSWMVYVSLCFVKPAELVARLSIDSLDAWIHLQHMARWMESDSVGAHSLVCRASNCRDSAVHERHSRSPCQRHPERWMYFPQTMM